MTQSRAFMRGFFIAHSSAIFPNSIKQSAAPTASRQKRKPRPKTDEVFY
jgi:hypothetical protein